MSRWLACLLALKPRLVTSSIVCSPRSSRFATSAGLREIEGGRSDISEQIVVWIYGLSVGLLRTPGVAFVEGLRHIAYASLLFISSCCDHRKDDVSITDVTEVSHKQIGNYNCKSLTQCFTDAHSIEVLFAASLAMSKGQHGPQRETD